MLLKETASVRNFTVDKLVMHAHRELDLIASIKVILLTMAIRFVEFSSGGVQNSKYFCIRMNIAKGNY